MSPLSTPFRRQANKEFQNTNSARRKAHLPIRITISLLLILLVVAAGAFVALPGSSAAPSKARAGADRLAATAGATRDFSNRSGLIGVQGQGLAPLSSMLAPAALFF